MAKRRLVAVEREAVAPDGQNRQEGAKIADDAAIAGAFFRADEISGVKVKPRLCAALVHEIENRLRLREDQRRFNALALADD